MTTPIARHPSQPKRWRVMFRHTSPGVNGLSENTYTFSDAYAMVWRWHPALRARVSLVPA